MFSETMKSKVRAFPVSSQFQRSRRVDFSGLTVQYMPVLELHCNILQAAEKERCCLQANLMKSSLTAPSGLCGCVQTVLDPHSLLHFAAPVGRRKSY